MSGVLPRRARGVKGAITPVFKTAFAIGYLDKELPKQLIFRTFKFHHQSSLWETIHITVYHIRDI